MVGTTWRWCSRGEDASEGCHKRSTGRRGSDQAALDRKTHIAIKSWNGWSEKTSNIIQSICHQDFPPLPPKSTPPANGAISNLQRLSHPYSSSSKEENRAEYTVQKGITHRFYTHGHTGWG